MGVFKPPPDNLGARQRALNAKVNDAAAKEVPFDVIQVEPEPFDIDKLYKIDLAAKYKNLPYILDILKSGDSLHTSRALKKCQWLYDDEFSHIVNPEYLEENVFPFTSMKMKRKIVKSAATRVRNAQRAAGFFHYCMAQKMKNTAFTSLLYTTEEFKLDQLRNNKDPTFETLQERDIIYFRFLVGKSFTLLDALLNFITDNWRITKIARQFKNMFSESEEKYLDIVEKYVNISYGFQTDKFDEKLSDAIMKKHKQRVLEKPRFYVCTVNTDVLVKNSSKEDAEIYAKALLPKTADEFWSLHHYTIYKSVFKIIPDDETYEFFKKYFAENYPNEEFEMHPGFNKQKYYKFMSFEQKEEWAYRQLKSEVQILGVGRDYLWYRFIKFDVAFEEIKRYVSITKKADVRSDMVQVLIQSARNDRELETLFKYYSKRHMNEMQKHKESFIDKVLERHNIFEIDERCWKEFYLLILAMEQSYIINDKVESASKNIISYKTIALLYHILHKKDMPEDLNKFLLEQFEMRFIHKYLKNISDDKKQQMLHDYFFSFYMNIITEARNKTFEYNEFNRDVEPKWRRYFDNLDRSMQIFNQDGETVEKPSGQHPKKKRYINPHEISGRSLIRDLKKDKDLIIGKLPKIKTEFEVSALKINTFLKKLKIYFPDFTAKAYLDMFQKIILNTDLVTGHHHRLPKHVKIAVKTGVNGIFQLADEDFKIDFMNRYCPVPSVEQKRLDIQHLRIQRAICRYACLSRPPVPLSSMVVYMKGDYLKNYCLHVFNTYLALLPLPICQQFVGLLLDAPVSIQKHAIRLSFRCFNPESLKEEISKIWKSTKNVSLRGVIYKAFYNKVLGTKEKLFYDVLETLTLDLNQDDEEEIFAMITSQDMPEDFLGDHIQAVWMTINKFKDLEPNITRKMNVVWIMRDNIHLMNEECVSNVVKEHINEMIHEDKLPLTYSKMDIAKLLIEKWILVAHYIIHNVTPDEPPMRYIQLSQYIVRKNIECWDKMAYGMHVYQKCCWEFFNNLKETSLNEEYGDFENAIPIFEGVLETINTNLQFYDSYLLACELKLILVTANVIKNHRQELALGLELEAVNRVIIEFGKSVGQLVSEYVESGTYFMSFSMKVKALIKSYLIELLKRIYIVQDEEVEGRNWQKNLNTALITLANALVTFEVPETYLLAIQLVPTEGKECSSDEFKYLVNKFQEFQNAEVQLSVYQTLQKYCNRQQSVPKSPSPCNIN